MFAIKHKKGMRRNNIVHDIKCNSKCLNTWKKMKIVLPADYKFKWELGWV